MAEQLKILVVEDESDIQELLRYNLASDGYEVATVDTGEQGLSQVLQFKPHLILLDLMLPGLGGLEVCKRLKGDPATRDAKVIMLTARGEEADVVLGLEAGADDYITKPFSPRILLARIRAVLRRIEEPDERTSVLRVGGIELDAERIEVKVEGVAVELTASEFKLLHHLMRKMGRVYTRQQIIDAVMGEDYAVTERSVDVQVVGLRKKLGSAADFIETVRGIGYRFKDAG